MFVRGEDIHLQTLRRRRHGTWLLIRYMVGLQAALRARRIAAATYGQPTVLGTQSLRVNKLIRRVKEKCAADYSHTCVCVLCCRLSYVQAAWRQTGTKYKCCEILRSRSGVYKRVQVCCYKKPCPFGNT